MKMIASASEIWNHSMISQINSLEQRFKYSVAQTCVVTLCLDLTVYIKRPFPEISAEVLHFYNEFIEVCGPYLKWYATQSMSELKPLTERTLSMIPFWFKPTTKIRGRYGFLAHSGATPEDAIVPAFHMYGDSDVQTANFIRMMLPVSFLSDDLLPFINLVKRSTGDLNFLSGHAGFSFYWNDRYHSIDMLARARVASWALRHDGIDIGKPLATIDFTLDAIKGVNWLTLINWDFCDRLGGLKIIQDRLAKDIRVHLLKHGIMIQAGSQPHIGDVNHQETLTHYHHVGRILRPIRLKWHDPMGGLDEENTLKWLARFDD